MLFGLVITGKGGGAVMFLEGSRLTLFGVLGRQVSCKVAKWSSSSDGSDDVDEGDGDLRRFGLCK